MTRNEKPINASNGMSWLPGGVLYQWGSGTTTNGGATSNGAASFSPAFTGLYTINISVLEPTNSRRFVKVATQSISGFTCWIQDDTGANKANTFYWTAIGF